MMTDYERRKLIQLREKGFSWRRIETEFKKDRQCRKYSHEWLRKVYNRIISSDETLKVLNVLGERKVIAIYELADELDLSPKRVRQVLESLIESGKDISIKDNLVIFNAPRRGAEVRIDSGTRDYLKLGIASDTHLGSRYQQLTALRDFYERCKDEGVTVVFHAGDWLAGKNVYKGQEYDIFLHSMREQREYLAEKYPRVEGIKTIGITGNHDESWTAHTGDKPVELAARHRDDIEIVAEYQAFVTVNGFKICLYHPDGAQAYAISYKLQKLVESFTAENLPDVVVMGHFHQKEYVTIRNVECFQAGCFEAQTPYQVRRNLHPVIGGWIIELVRTKNGVQVVSKFIKYVPRLNDF